MQKNHCRKLFNKNWDSLHTLRPLLSLRLNFSKEFSYILPERAYKWASGRHNNENFMRYIADTRYISERDTRGAQDKLFYILCFLFIFAFHSFDEQFYEFWQMHRVIEITQLQNTEQFNPLSSSSCPPTLSSVVYSSLDPFPSVSQESVSFLLFCFP